MKLKSKRLIMILVGILILGIEVALCNIIGLGIYPFATMNIGASNKILTNHIKH